MAENIKDILTNDFKHDPVYRMVIDSKLEGYLFPDSLLEVDTNKTYSTIEVGRIIGRKDSTIRNYFNTELLDYIAPEKVGNLYRLDYINIFKIHMISLLFEKGRKSKSEIAYNLGIKPGVKLGRSNEVPEFIKEQNKDIEEVKKYLLVEKMKTNLLNKQNNLQKLINEKQEKQIRFNQLKAEKYDLLNANVEEKYFEALETAVEDLASLQDINTKLVKETKEKKGIFSWFKKTKENNTDHVTPTLSSSTEKISSILKGTGEQIEENRKRVKEIEESMLEIKSKIEVIDKNIEDETAKINQYETYIGNAEGQLLPDEEMFNQLLLEGSFSNDVSKP